MMLAAAQQYLLSGIIRSITCMQCGKTGMIAVPADWDVIINTIDTVCDDCNSNRICPKYELDYEHRESSTSPIR